MRMLMVIALISTLLLFGCISGEISGEVSPEEKYMPQNKVLDCQCHEEPWKYEAHQKTNCKECHGNEILKEHRAFFQKLGYREYVNATSVALIDCYKCHETSLLKNHMPAGCELCHGNPADIHEKYEDEFMKRGVSE
jgi:DnaJ-class molecular chaperone